MKTYKIVEIKKYNKFGEIKNIVYEIYELTFKFFNLKLWKPVDDNKPYYAKTLIFGTIYLAETFIETVLKKNLPRNQQLKKTIKIINI